MSMRKGQVTIFIIIAILLLFVFIWLYSLVWGASGDMPADQERVFNYVTSCLEQVGADSLVVFGKQGRLEQFRRYDPLNLEYYYDGIARVPANEDVEIELARYVDAHFAQCINDFKGFPVLKFTSVSAPDAIVSLDASSVTFDLKYHIEFEIELVQYTLEDYTVTLDVPLSKYLYDAEHFVSYYMQHGAIDASYNLLPLQHLEVHQHNTTLVLGLYDNATMVIGEPYLLAFAVRS